MTTTIQPIIGMGCTIHQFTDKTPATIIEVSPNGKKISLQEDAFTRTDTRGFSELQDYSYAPNKDGVIYVATLRKNGKWQILGTKNIVSLGERKRYYDYSF
jgi:hypothetical protein